ncbi:MAG: acyltransferase family protein, partial [Pseudomonadota bacterium]
AVAVFCTNKESFPGFWALLPCLGAGFIFYTAQTGTGRVHKILSFKPLTAVGLISYSLYLWHWPLIAFYKSYAGDALDITAQMTLFAVSLIMAFLSYRFIEQPSAKWRLKPVFVIALGVAVAVLFILDSNVLKHGDDANWRMTSHVDKVETVANDYFRICAVPRGVLNVNQCIIGPHKDNYEIVLSGDSHAAHYVPAVLAWAKTQGLTVRLMLRGACQAWVPSVLPPKKGGEIDTDCLKIRDELYDVLATQKSVKYLFLALKLPKDTPDNRAALERVAAYHKTTIFLGSVPIFERNPHDCRIKNHLLIGALFHKKGADENCQKFDAAYSNAQLAGTLT